MQVGGWVSVCVVWVGGCGWGGVGRCNATMSLAVSGQSCGWVGGW